MFSQTVEYSLRAMVALASHYNEPMTVQKISEVTDVPRPYLSKMMGKLVRANMVKSQRGLGGGFLLANPPKETTILDIMKLVEPVKASRTLPTSVEGSDILGPLHLRLDQAVTQVEKSFQDLTLEDVVKASKR